MGTQQEKTKSLGLAVEAYVALITLPGPFTLTSFSP